MNRDNKPHMLNPDRATPGLDRGGVLSTKLLSALEEIFSDKRNLLAPSANLLLKRIELDTVFNNVSLAFQGDFVFADRDSTGIGYVKFNNAGMPDFPFVRNTLVKNFPIKELFISNRTPQPGTFLNLWVGYGADIVPPTLDIATISGLVTTQDGGSAYSSKFSSSAALAGSGTENVWTVAGNPNSARVVEILNLDINASNISQGIFVHAHTGVPAAFTDGDVISGSAENSVRAPLDAYFLAFGKLGRPLQIAAGKGLWFRNAGFAQTTANRSVLFTLF